MIGILDYGAGNLHSVQNALSFLGAQSVVTGQRAEILSCQGIILPGVGSFGDAMASLRQCGLEPVVQEYIAGGRPFLGICLGMQLLFESSEESPGVKGLGLMKGVIRRIPGGPGFKIPHMGWNSLDICKTDGLYQGLPDQTYVYFVHSFYLDAADKQEVSATTDYSARLDVSVERGNIWAAQFHPEKSGRAGLTMLENFIKRAEEGSGCTQNG